MSFQYIGNNRIHNCNGQTIIGNLCTVNGNNNTITGNDCMVTGNRNTINGNSCTVKGDRNSVKGNACTVKGNMNTVKGNTCIATGDRNSVKACSGRGSHVVVGSHVGGMVFNNSPGSVIGHQGSGSTVNMSDGNFEVRSYSSTCRSGSGSQVIVDSFIDGDLNFDSKKRTRKNNRKSYSLGNNNHNLIQGTGNVVVVSSTQLPLKIPSNERIVDIPDQDKLRDDTRVAEDADNNVRTCVICLDNVAICVVQPCGHNILCVKCTRETYEDVNRADAKCPKCRHPVKRVMRVYD